MPQNFSHRSLLSMYLHLATTEFDIYGEKETHWLETIHPWNHEQKVEFLKDFWYKPDGYIRTRTFPTDWRAFETIMDGDLETREVLDCIHCGEPVVNMMRYMRKHAAICPKIDQFKHKQPLHNYLCPKCNETCKRNLTMEVHLKYNHYCKENNESEEFHCDQCNYTVFPDMERLHYHRRLHRNTPVFKMWNDSHTMPWTVQFKDALPHFYKSNVSYERYKQDMSTDELEVLMEKPELFDEDSIALDEHFQKDLNESLEFQKLWLSGNTQWQVDLLKKYENMSTHAFPTRSVDQILENNRKHYMRERKELGLEVDYFYAEKYTNKYTRITHFLEDKAKRRKYAKEHDWNKTRVEAFQEFDKLQDLRRYSILCHHMSIPFTTEPITTVLYDDANYISSAREEEILCSHYTPQSNETEEDPNSKDWKFTPL